MQNWGLGGARPTLAKNSEERGDCMRGDGAARDAKDAERDIGRATDIRRRLGSVKTVEWIVDVVAFLVSTPNDPVDCL